MSFTYRHRALPGVLGFKRWVRMCRASRGLRIKCDTRLFRAHLTRARAAEVKPGDIRDSVRKASRAVLVLAGGVLHVGLCWGASSPGRTWGWRLHTGLQRFSYQGLLVVQVLFIFGGKRNTHM